MSPQAPDDPLYDYIDLMWGETTADVSVDIPEYVRGERVLTLTHHWQSLSSNEMQLCLAIRLLFIVQALPFGRLRSAVMDVSKALLVARCHPNE